MSFTVNIDLRPYFNKSIHTLDTNSLKPSRSFQVSHPRLSQTGNFQRKVLQPHNPEKMLLLLTLLVIFTLVLLSVYSNCPEKCHTSASEAAREFYGVAECGLTKCPLMTRYWWKNGRRRRRQRRQRWSSTTTKMGFACSSNPEKIVMPICSFSSTNLEI